MSFRIDYRLLLNQAPDAMYDGYTTGDPLEDGYRGHLLSDTYERDLAACKRIFEIFNIDHPPTYHNRSMAVGDVLILNRNGISEAFASSRLGFRKITIEEANAGIEGAHADN